MKRSFFAAPAAAIIVLSAPDAEAASVRIMTSEGTAKESQHGMHESTSVRGNDLAGMNLTATYVDGSDEELVWEAYDPWTNGGAVGSGLDISAGWQGFSLTTTRRLATLTLDASTASAVFDIDPMMEGPGDTAGTKNGFAFQIEGSTSLEGEIIAKYSNIFSIAGHETGIDAYTTLLLDFRGLAGGGLLGTLNFNSDLDSLAIKGDVFEVSAVPLPEGMPMTLTGMAVLAGLGMRRRAKG